MFGVKFNMSWSQYIFPQDVSLCEMLLLNILAVEASASSDMFQNPCQLVAKHKIFKHYGKERGREGEEGRGGEERSKGGAGKRRREEEAKMERGG